MKGISHVEIVTNSRSEIEAAANKWRKALGMPGCVQLSAAETIAAERERKAGIRRQLEKEMAEHVSEGELSAEQRREREQHRAGAAWARACSDGKVLKKTGARLLVSIWGARRDHGSRWSKPCGSQTAAEKPVRWPSCATFVGWPVRWPNGVQPCWLIGGRRRAPLGPSKNGSRGLRPGI
jgi:hypothetical protein